MFFKKKLIKIDHYLETTNQRCKDRSPKSAWQCNPLDMADQCYDRFQFSSIFNSFFLLLFSVFCFFYQGVVEESTVGQAAPPATGCFMIVRVLLIRQEISVLFVSASVEIYYAKQCTIWCCRWPRTQQDTARTSNPTLDSPMDMLDPNVCDNRRIWTMRYDKSLLRKTEIFLQCKVDTIMNYEQLLLFF